MAFLDGIIAGPDGNIDAADGNNCCFCQVIIEIPPLFSKQSVDHISICLCYDKIKRVGDHAPSFRSKY